MGLRKQRLRRLTILAALILLVAGGLWVSRTHGSEGDKATTPAPSPITNPEVSQTDRTRQVLTLALGAINLSGGVRLGDRDERLLLALVFHK